MPQDPVILLSYINTKLRDSYASLEQLCQDMAVDQGELEQKLGMLNYAYDAKRNQFI